MQVKTLLLSVITMFSAYTLYGMDETTYYNARQAIENEDEQQIQILLDQGIDVDSLPPARPGSISALGRTLFAFACGRQKYKLMQLLFLRGADINTRDFFGMTPLAKASFEGHTSVVYFLLARGADSNALDTDGATPLHHAVKNNHLEVAESLLARGARVYTVNRDYDCTPLEGAVANRNGDMVKLLIQYAIQQEALEQLLTYKFRREDHQIVPNDPRQIFIEGLKNPSVKKDIFELATQDLGNFFPTAAHFEYRLRNTPVISDSIITFLTEKLIDIANSGNENAQWMLRKKYQGGKLLFSWCKQYHDNTSHTLTRSNPALRYAQDFAARLANQECCVCLEKINDKNQFEVGSPSYNCLHFICKACKDQIRPYAPNPFNPRAIVHPSCPLCRQ